MVNTAVVSGYWLTEKKKKKKTFYRKKKENIKKKTKVAVKPRKWRKKDGGKLQR